MAFGVSRAFEWDDGVHYSNMASDCWLGGSQPSSLLVSWCLVVVSIKVQLSAGDQKAGSPVECGKRAVLFFKRGPTNPPPLKGAGGTKTKLFFQRCRDGCGGQNRFGIPFQ